MNARLYYSITQLFGVIIKILTKIQNSAHSQIVASARGKPFQWYVSARPKVSNKCMLKDFWVCFYMTDVPDYLPVQVWVDHLQLCQKEMPNQKTCNLPYSSWFI